MKGASWVHICMLFVCGIGGYFGVDCVSFEEDVKITFKQKQAIDKLRQRVLPHISEDFMKEDIYLVRWLRATDFDISSAEKNFIENVKWRKELKMGTIVSEDFSDLQTDFPYLTGGFDKEGRPILIAFSSQWDIRKAVITGIITRVMRYLWKGFEETSRTIRSLASEGKNVTQAILIVDLSDFNVVQHGCPQCLIRILEFLRVYETHYPGMSDKVIFTDSPPTISFALQLVLQNSNKYTRDAINVFGQNKEQWKSFLLRYIDKKYLPVELGGTLERN